MHTPDTRNMCPLGRYTVETQGDGDGDGTGATLNIQPKNMVLAVGTAVAVQGIISCPEINGRHGLVEGFDAEFDTCVVLSLVKNLSYGVDLPKTKLSANSERK